MNIQPTYINRRVAFKSHFAKEIRQERIKTVVIYVLATPLAIILTYLALWAGYIIGLAII